jgi:hypothetical protein
VESGNICPLKDFAMSPSRFGKNPRGIATPKGQRKITEHTAASVAPPLKTSST